MFTRLIESAPRRHRPVAQGLCSFALHAALGFGLIKATQRLAAPLVAAPPMVVLDPWRPALPPASPAVRQVPTRPAPTAPVSQWSLPPLDEPTPVIRSVVQAAPPLSDRLSYDPLARICLSCPTDSTPSATAVFSIETVDEPAKVLSQPKPAYPPVLMQAGISGRVLLEFVVDTAGQVEPGSIQVVERTHPGFETSAREVIDRSRFAPARIRGVAVRQLVRQAVRYQIP